MEPRLLGRLFDFDPFGGPGRKRALGMRDKQILWKRANGRCEGCGKKIDFTDMQVGHKTAFSKGGGTTIKNSAALCYSCNRLQGTDSWATFIKKLGPAARGSEAKAQQAKAAAKKPKKKRPKSDDPFGLGQLFRL